MQKKSAKSLLENEKVSEDKPITRGAAAPDKPEKRLVKFKLCFNRILLILY